MNNGVVIRDAIPADLAGLAAIRYADRSAIHRDRIHDATNTVIHYLVSELHLHVVGLRLLVLE